MNRYSNIEILKNTSYGANITVGTQYYVTTRYPEIPLHESDIYVITDFGDRLDLLSNQFYSSQLLKLLGLLLLSKLLLPSLVFHQIWDE